MRTEEAIPSSLRDVGIRCRAVPTKVALAILIASGYRGLFKNFLHCWDGWMDGWMDGWIDGSMDRSIDRSRIARATRSVIQQFPASGENSHRGPDTGNNHLSILIE